MRISISVSVVSLRRGRVDDFSNSAKSLSVLSLTTLSVFFMPVARSQEGKNGIHGASFRSILSPKRRMPQRIVHHQACECPHRRDDEERKALRPMCAALACVPDRLCRGAIRMASHQAADADIERSPRVRTHRRIAFPLRSLALTSQLRELVSRIILAICMYGYK